MRTIKLFWVVVAAASKVVSNLKKDFATQGMPFFKNMLIVQGDAFAKIWIKQKGQKGEMNV